MVATSSTLVMHRTLWMAPTFCTATMAFGTLAFPHARVCTHSVLTRSWPLNYYYHLEGVSGLLMHFNWAWLFSFVATCTDPGLIDRGERNGTDFSHGQVVTYECSTKNYNLVGNPRLTCNDGVWDSAPPVCKSEYLIKHMFAKHVTQTRLGHTFKCNKVLAIFHEVIGWYSIAQLLLL